MADWIMAALNILFGFYGIYFVAVVLLGLGRKHNDYPHSAPKKRIAAVIAARNEEAVIAACVKTLLSQRYPEELCDVWVIPNNCSDGTEQAAREAGAKIMECTVPVTCKGDVLSFAFDRLLETNDYDAFCIFDADNLIDPDFFTEANNALCSGQQIAQGYRDSKNPEESWIAGSMSIFHWFMSHFFNRSRTALGMSAMLNGTGIVVSADLIREIGWHTDTLTEDLEYSAQCALKGVKIGWMSKAVIYDEQANNFADTFEQRRRWFAGTIQCLKRYGFALWKRAFKHRDMQSLDFALFFTGAITQSVCLIPGALSFLMMALKALKRGGIGLLLLECSGMFLLFFVGCTVGGAIMTMIARKSTDKMWPGIFGLWLFMASWLPANLAGALLRTEWKQIPHTSKAQLPVATKKTSKRAARREPYKLKP